MDEIVKLKNKKTKYKKQATKEFTFEVAQNILRLDKNGDFEVAEPKKWQFDGKNLIKQPKKKADKE